MAVGLGRSRADIDYRAGQLSVGLRNLLDDIDRFQAFLAATPDADLTDPEIGYTTGEVATLKSSYVDLSKLAAIYRGADTQTPAYDFRTFSAQLMGVQ